MLDKTPKQIDMMLKTLAEMKIGAEPDESADYWEERKTIDQQILALKGIRSRLDGLGKVYAKKRAEYDSMQAAARKPMDTAEMDSVAREMKQATVELQAQLNNAFDCRDEANEIKKDMADCDIPVNIQVRRNEV